MQNLAMPLFADTPRPASLPANATPLAGTRSNWIAVASAEHARRGRDESKPGFMQVGHGKLGGLKAADAQLMWQVHVHALGRIANIVVPKMADAGSGRVVIIGSRVSARRKLV